MVAYVVAGAVLAAWIATLAVVGRAAFVVLDRTKGPPQGAAQGLHERVSALEMQIQGLPSLWETERKRMEEEAQRAANRYAAARAAESRARTLREEDEDSQDDDGEGQGVLPFDGDGGDPRGMFSMPEPMAQPTAYPSGAPVGADLLKLLLLPINGRGV